MGIANFFVFIDYKYRGASKKTNVENLSREFRRVFLQYTKQLIGYMIKNDLSFDNDSDKYCALRILDAPRNSCIFKPPLFQHFKLLFHSTSFFQTVQHHSSAIFQKVWTELKLKIENVTLPYTCTLLELQFTYFERFSSPTPSLEEVKCEEEMALFYFSYLKQKMNEGYCKKQLKIFHQFMDSYSTPVLIYFIRLDNFDEFFQYEKLNNTSVESVSITSHNMDYDNTDILQENAFSMQVENCASAFAFLLNASTTFILAFTNEAEATLKISRNRLPSRFIKDCMADSTEKLMDYALGQVYEKLNKEGNKNQDPLNIYRMVIDCHSQIELETRLNLIQQFIRRDMLKKMVCKKCKKLSH